MKLAISAIFIFLTVQSRVFSEDCESRDFGNDGTVCVCNSDSCSRLEAVAEATENEFLTYTSNKEGLRLSLERGSFGEAGEGNVISVDESVTYQSVEGFGGAFTDSTGINILSLSEDLQEEVLKAYFSAEEGIGYTIGRVPMGSTDFSLGPYTFHDEEDPTLSNFTLQNGDFVNKIPFMKKALELSETLKFFTSTWIAPLWMKSNGKYTGPNTYIKEEYTQAWADYFVKFLDKYQEEGITFWGITTGNEPSSGMLAIALPSVAWNSTSLREWVKTNLGPALRSSKHADIKLLLLDDQRIFLPNSVEEVFESQEAYDYVDGIAVHWYTDKFTSASVLTRTHNKFPEKFILATEACSGASIPPHVSLGSWSRGEDYANSIIEDMNNWVTGWVDWNMVLNLQGGPTYINNFVDSPIIVNATANEFYKQPMYYAMGHFSKFVPRGSQRIEVSSFTSGVPVTAFKKPDGGIVLVILNKESNELSVSVNDAKRGGISLDLTPYSITTLIYQ